MSRPPIFDVHVHIQPWQMVRPEVLAMLQHPSREGTKEILSNPLNLLRHLDGEGIERICCINYVSPEVTGFTREVNDWILDYTEGHRDRLLPVGSVNPLVESDIAGELRRILDRGLRMRIILAHAGRPLHGDTAFFLARRHPNVMLDVSGIPPKSLTTQMPRLADLSRKVLWGTDWPSPGVLSMRGIVDDFLALGYPDDVARDVLGRNATQLFGVSPG